MKSEEIRKKFLEFFKKRGHRVVESSSLLPNDPSVLLTTAGMQQFKPYYTGKKDPMGDFGCRRTCSIQKCFRTSDIDSVGDISHETFLEMLGNFSFGDYFKEECLKFEYDLFTKVFGVDPKRIVPSVFKGDNDVPKDIESIKILKSLGFKKIKELGREDNFWGPTGDEGPCGPTVEFYVNNVEIGNFVFNQYYQDKNGKLTPLKQTGVDVGIGLERLAMIVQNKKNIFETDLLEPIMDKINELKIKKIKDERVERIIIDHIRGVVFLISDGVRPSNVEQGYVLRRILRRIIRYSKLLGLKEDYLEELINVVIELYKDRYPELVKNQKELLRVVKEENKKFEKTLDRGLKEFNKLQFKNKMGGKESFYLYQSYGFPLEIIKDLAKEKNLKVDEAGFEIEFKKHQKLSKAGVGKKFGGVGDYGDKVAKQHTATHLLHQALRDVLGKEVQQAGSDLTPERLRFDFTFHRAVTKEEIKKVEGIVNEKIKEGLKVTYREMRYEAAIKDGTLAFFKERYPEKIRVYSIGNYSKEICAGPHVKNTKELKYFKILNEKSSAAGIRRIKAIVG